MESCEFKRKLGFNVPDVFNINQKTVTGIIKDAFENMQTEYYLLSHRIDFYFPKHKSATEALEFGHSNRNIENEIQRQKAIEKELDSVFIRINTNKKRYKETLKNQ